MEIVKTTCRPVAQMRKREDDKHKRLYEVQIELFYTGEQEKQSSVLTLMEKYMCLLDIHKVYSGLFFVCSFLFFSIIQMRTGTGEVFSCQVFPCCVELDSKQVSRVRRCIPEISQQICTQASPALLQSNHII